MKKNQRQLYYIIAAALLCLLVVCGIGLARRKQPTVTLNVSLYKLVPDYEHFKQTVSERWKEIHPEVELCFSDWDCYSGVVPDDLDVFVFDTINLDTFAGKGYLLALSEEDVEEYSDLIPAFMDGCRVNGDLYAVPQLLCTDLLYTRKEDADLKDVDNIFELYKALEEGKLLYEKPDNFSKTTMYLQALTDAKQQYLAQYPSIKAGRLSAKAVQSLEALSKMHQADPGDGGDGIAYYYAGKYAEGMGRAYIGFSEAMHAMGDVASEMDFRLFSMTDDQNIAVFYADAAAINAKISEEKAAYALDLLNLLTDKDTLLGASVHGGEAQYLLLPRYSVYDALAADYPIYRELKSIIMVPDAYVFRIKPDGYSYIKEALKNADALPVLAKP